VRCLVFEARVSKKGGVKGPFLQVTHLKISQVGFSAAFSPRPERFFAGFPAQFSPQKYAFFCI